MEPLVPFKNKKKKTSTAAPNISRAVSTVSAVLPKSVTRAMTSIPSMPRPVPPAEDRIPFTLPPIQWKPPPPQVKFAAPPPPPKTVSRARTSIPSVPQERAPFTLPPRANLTSFTIPKKSSSKSEKKTSPIMANLPKLSQKDPKLWKSIGKETFKEDISQKVPKRDSAAPKAQKALKIVPMKKRSIVPSQAVKAQKAVLLKIVVPTEEYPMRVMPAKEAPWIPMPVKEAPTVTVEDPMETMDVSNDSTSNEPWYAVEEQTDVVLSPWLLEGLPRPKRHWESRWNQDVLEKTAKAAAEVPMEVDEPQKDYCIWQKPEKKTAEKEKKRTKTAIEMKLKPRDDNRNVVFTNVTRARSIPSVRFADGRTFDLSAYGMDEFITH